MAKFVKCDVCGETTYIIHDWVLQLKNLPCAACEAIKKTQEEKKMWEEYAALTRGKK